MTGCPVSEPTEVTLHCTEHAESAPSRNNSGYTTGSSPPVTDACGQVVEMQIFLGGSVSQMFLHTHLGKKKTLSTEQRGSGLGPAQSPQLEASATTPFVDVLNR